MKKIIKKILNIFGLYNPAKGIKISQDRKAEILLSCKTPATEIFIETGTHEGDMIEVFKKYFKELHTVELNEDLYSAAVSRFRGENNIYLYRGDSAQEIYKILKNIKTPALIWLDAHASGAINFKNSPIESELRAIFGHPVKGHIILIDDARHFNIRDIRKIKTLAYANKYSCLIEEGLFRLTPTA